MAELTAQTVPKLVKLKYEMNWLMINNKKIIPPKLLNTLIIGFTTSKLVLTFPTAFPKHIPGIKNEIKIKAIKLSIKGVEPINSSVSGWRSGAPLGIVINRINASTTNHY